jgi:hypothetical protein
MGAIETQRATAAEWLAAAHTSPQRVYKEWLEQRFVLFPLGRRWDVVKLPAPDAHTVRGLLDKPGVNGPILHDPRRRALYILVPAGTATGWALPGTTCLGTGSYLGVPAPSHTAPTGYHWAIPPDGTGQLTDPLALRHALSSAATALSRQGDSPR